MSSGEILLNGEKISGKAPYEINRRGLSRSFQVTNIFQTVGFREFALRLLWSLGYRYAFWTGSIG